MTLCLLDPCVPRDTCMQCGMRVQEEHRVSNKLAICSVNFPKENRARHTGQWCSASPAMVVYQPCPRARMADVW